MESQRAATGEHAAVDGNGKTVNERVAVLEYQVLELDKDMEARRKSSEGLRAEQAAVTVLLGRIDVRLSHIETAAQNASKREWSWLLTAVNLVAGAILAIASSYFMRH